MRIKERLKRRPVDAVVGVLNRLSLKESLTDPYTYPIDFPKIIWIFWAQGLDEAPDLVRHCIGSWEARNPSWDIRILDDKTVSQYVDQTQFPDGLSIQSRSDLIRLKLLKLHGGVWVDATCFCMRPLDHWLPALMTAGFFAFSRPTPLRALESWFLASSVENKIVDTYLQSALDYSSNRNMQIGYPYFWIMYLPDWLRLSNRWFRSAWAAVPRVSARPYNMLALALSDEAEFPQNIQALPLHKLSWKRGFTKAQLIALGLDY